MVKNFKNYTFKIIDKLNIFLGQKLFSNLNIFTYNLFNYFYKLIIVKKKPDYIKNYIENGHQKFPSVPEKYIDNLIENLNKQKEIITNNSESIKEKGHHAFDLTDEIKDNILKIINNPLSPLIENLKIYFNSEIILSDSRISRNYKINSGEEKYSNFFHNDNYICTLIKVFINLQDVTINHGPLRFIKKKDAKKVLKKNFININRIPNIKQHDLINYNEGKKGEIFICDTTKIIHSAGIPENSNYRDMLFLEFCACPNKKNIKMIDKKDNDEITFPKEYLSKIISKPAGLKNLIKCFFSYI